MTRKKKEEKLTIDLCRSFRDAKFPGGYRPADTAGDCRYEPQLALNALLFIEGHVKHAVGELAAQPLKLEKWQRALVATIFGWVRPDGNRRYRYVYIEIPRKAGKSTLAAAIALVMMYLDNEPRAEVYSCAGDRKQAKIIFRTAKAMVLQSDLLRRHTHCYAHSIVPYHQKTGIETAVYEALSADGDTKHGLNPSAVLFDELHVQPNRNLYDVMRTGMGARRQPLFLMITTAGFDRESICYDRHLYAKSVADVNQPEFQDEQFLPVVYAAEPDDDWRDPKTWRKANPNLGVSVKEEYYAAECRAAMQNPASLNSFLQLQLNIWTTQRSRAINPYDWDACSDSEWPELRKASWFAGVDLAHTSDLCAYVRVADYKGKLYVASHFWIPRDTALEVQRSHGIDYLRWEQLGAVTLTDGDVTDYAYIREAIKSDAKTHNLCGIGVDPYNATHLMTLLVADGVRGVQKYTQSVANLNEPFKDISVVRVPTGQLAHDGNPVLAWCASNVEAKKDAGDRWRPVKPQDSPAAKIDGISALCMANGLRIADERARATVYQKRGVISG